MKTFRINYIKKQKIKMFGPEQPLPNIFLELVIKTDNDKIEIPTYPGYDIIAITEMIPDLDLTLKVLSNDKKN